MTRAIVFAVALAASSALAGELPATTGYKLQNGSLYFGDNPPASAKPVATLPAVPVPDASEAPSNWSRSPEQAALDTSWQEQLRWMSVARDERDRREAAEAQVRQLQAMPQQPQTVVIFQAPAERRHSVIFGR